jgi:DNA repair exonuclease SbcCD ATPase subunit
MKINSMFVQNFLSFGDRTTFQFADQGLVLVEGENCDDASAKSNGAGKSAMIDALVWCLFGKTLRGYDGDEVVNRKVGENCVVSVSLGDEWVVTRARRHVTMKNKLIVASPDQDESGPSNTETQEIVERILGCTMQTFMSSVVFGQDAAYKFSSLTDKQQKDILDEVLGVERFAEACNVARSQLAVGEASVDVAQRDLEKATEAYDVAASDVEDLTEKRDSFDSEHKKKIAAEQERLDKAKAILKKFKKSEVDLGELRVKLAYQKATVDQLSKAIEARTTNVIDAKAKRSSAKQMIEDARAHVKRHEKVVGECPTCGQKVDTTQGERVLADYKKKLILAEKAFKDVDAACIDIQSQHDEANVKLTDARERVSKIHDEIQEVVNADAALVQARDLVDSQKARIQELEMQTNPFGALVKKAKDRKDRHAAEVKLLGARVSEEEEKLGKFKFWVDAFGAKGLRSLLLDTSLPILNDEAQRISRAITGGSISIEFSATSDLKSGKSIDRFEVRVDNKHGAGNYQGNSAGEKAKVDLCVGLAQQRLVASRSKASFNIVFLDEVFDHLDQAAHERIVDVLSEIDKESVFVISHNEDLQAWFPNTLTIQKKNGFSTVVT